jgi:hypothetical protein
LTGTANCSQPRSRRVSSARSGRGQRWTASFERGGEGGTICTTGTICDASDKRPFESEADGRKDTLSKRGRVGGQPRAGWRGRDRASQCRSRRPEAPVRPRSATGRPCSRSGTAAQRPPCQRRGGCGRCPRARGQPCRTVRRRTTNSSAGRSQRYESVAVSTHHAAEDGGGLVKEDERLVELGDRALVHDDDAVVECDGGEAAERTGKGRWVS